MQNYPANLRSLNDIFDFFAKDFAKGAEALRESNMFGNTFPPYNLSIDRESKDLKYEFALAGYNPDEIEVTFDGDYLRLSVEKIEKNEEEKKENSFALIQKGIKSASSRLKAPVPASRYDQDNAKASFDNGILTVFIPRKEEEKPRKLQITS